MTPSKISLKPLVQPSEGHSSSCSLSVPSAWVPATSKSTLAPVKSDQWRRPCRAFRALWFVAFSLVALSSTSTVLCDALAISEKGQPQPCPEAIVKAVKEDDIETVKESLSQDSSLRTCTTTFEAEGYYSRKEEVTGALLHLAAHLGLNDTVEALLDGGVDVNIPTIATKGGYCYWEPGSTALMLAAAAPDAFEAAKVLVGAPGILLNAQPQERRLTALMWAVLRGNSEVVSLLVKVIGIDVNLVDQDGRSTLSWAAANGHSEVVSLLLKITCIKVNLVDEDGRSALMRAAYNGHSEVVATLLSADGLDVNRVDKDGKSALVYAFTGGYSEMVWLLAKVKGIKANIVDKDSHESALMWAARNGHTEVVSSLLSVKGIDVNILNKDKMTAFLLAASNGHDQVVDRFYSIARESIDVNLASEDGMTALMLAASKGHEPVLWKLLGNRKGLIDADAKNKDGLTALMLAAQHGHEEVVETMLFLARGFLNVNLQNEAGFTALMLAVQNGHTEVIKVMLKSKYADVDVNIRNEDGDTALMLVVAAGKRTAAETLLDSKEKVSDFSLTNKAGWTLLHQAVNAKENSLELVKYVLDKNRDASLVNSTTKENATALQMATEKGNLEVVMTLLRNDAGVRDASQEDHSALRLAIQRGSYFTVKILLDYGATVEDDIESIQEEADRDEAKTMAAWMGVEFSMLELVTPFTNETGTEWAKAVFSEPPSNCSGDMEGKCTGSLMAHARTAEMVHVLWNWQECDKSYKRTVSSSSNSCYQDRKEALVSNLRKNGGDKAALALLSRGVGRELEEDDLNNVAIAWQRPADEPKRILHHIRVWNPLHWSAHSCDSVALTSAYKDGHDLKILDLLIEKPKELEDAPGETPEEVAQGNSKRCPGVVGVLRTLQDFRRAKIVERNMYALSAITADISSVGTMANRLLILQLLTFQRGGWWRMLALPATLILIGGGIAWIHWQQEGDLRHNQIAMLGVGCFTSTSGILLLVMMIWVFNSNTAADRLGKIKKRGNAVMDRFWEKLECGIGWSLCFALFIQAMLTQGRQLALIVGVMNAVANTLPLLLASPRFLTIPLRLLPGVCVVAWWVYWGSATELPSPETLLISATCLAVAWCDIQGPIGTLQERFTQMRGPRRRFDPEIEMATKKVSGKFTANKLIFGRAEIAAHGIERALGLSVDQIAAGLKDPIAAMRQEVEASGDRNDRENFKYIVEGISGREEDLPSAVAESLKTGIYHGGHIEPDDFDTGHHGRSLAQWMEVKEVVLANLTEAEFVAVRFYTSSSFPKINGPLRKAAQAVLDNTPASEVEPHPWRMVVYLMDKGIKKLRSVQAQVDPEAFARQTVLWRGMKNMAVDLQQFYKHGGTEMAPMSTTTNEDVARHYSESKVPLMFKYVVGGLKTGVCIQFLSLYPKEEEFLYAPLTYLTVKNHYEDDGTTIIVVEPVMS